MHLTVQARETSGKGSNRKLRNQGLIPGIVYGKGNMRVSMGHDEMIRFIKSLRGVKKIIDLGIETNGTSESKKVIIQDYQLSKVGGKLLHVDFFEVSDNTVLTADIPISIINDNKCPAIKEGGVLQIVRRTIPVTCLARHIPESIQVDVEQLRFGESIHVLDIKYPEGVNPIVKDRNFTLITIAGRMKEEVEVAEGVEEAELEGAEPEGAEVDKKIKSE